ncbi:hypothetical protein MKW94_023353 [Papaver nudicaule]|uniref:At3g05675-like ankyrin-like domain-containing protein n=1 Tax=Papaver nudicaule TaxID=74823 RepID=A0AA41RY69_PAPNU|nr:hypothetical protein [Papaver nudicaule]
MASSSSFVHLLRLAAIHPYNQQQTFRRPKPMLPSQTYVHAANYTSTLTRASISFSNPLLITGQKHNLQFLSPKTLQQPNFSINSTNTTALCENTTSSKKITPKIPGTEICILVSVYIIPFLNRLDLPSKFPVLKYAMSPIMPLLGFYQSIPALGLIAFLALFIGYVRYRNSTKLKYSLQAMVMDCLVVVASLVRPVLVNPSTVGALGFNFQLLNVLELLGFQTCVHSCLEYLGDVQWIGEGKMEKINAATDVSCPSFDALAHTISMVLKADIGTEGRRIGKSLALKLLSKHDSDVNFAERYNDLILSSCQSCLNSLLKLYKQCGNKFYLFLFDAGGVLLNQQIHLEGCNLLWLLKILEDRQAAEKFALIWANQQELANLHMKFRMPHGHLVTFITGQLFVGIGKGKILAGNDTRQLLFRTWYQPLVNDYSRLQNYSDFDQKAVEENIERTILELKPELDEGCTH